MQHHLAVMLVILSGTAVAESDRGIAIEPGESGVFCYSDDFTTPRVLRDAFLANAGPEIWTPGALISSGPERRRDPDPGRGGGPVQRRQRPTLMSGRFLQGPFARCTLFLS